MINFVHKLFNPHCSHCRDEMRERLICDSCEILKNEVARLERDNQRLLNALLEKPEPIIEKEPDIKDMKAIRPGNHIPWSVRQQQLEAEDRERARLTKAAPKPDSTIPSIPLDTKLSMEELEEKILADA